MLHAVDGSDLGFIHKYLHKIVRFRNSQNTFVSNLGQRSCIDCHSPTQIHVFKGLRIMAVHLPINHLLQRQRTGKFHFRNRNKRHWCFRYGRQFLISVFFQGLAQQVIFLCWLSIFIDRCIIIIGSDIGSKSWTICTCPMAKRSTAMSHIEREGDSFGKHFIDPLHHSLCRTGFMTGSPLIKPAAPELRTHQWTVGTQLLQLRKLLIDIGTRSKIHGPYQIVKSVLGKV